LFQNTAGYLCQKPETFAFNCNKDWIRRVLPDRGHVLAHNSGRIVRSYPEQLGGLYFVDLFNCGVSFWFRRLLENMGWCPSAIVRPGRGNFPSIEALGTSRIWHTGVCLY